MVRRSLLQSLAAIVALPTLSSRSNAAPAELPPDFPSLTKSTSEWRALLDPAPFQVLFEEATERPFSSELEKEHRPGTFVCAACFLPLFDAEHKFDSGTGWPSFTQSIPGHTASKRDFKLLLPRTEYHCARCTGHQGHVFDDGPPPRGERWCNNGLALIFVPRNEPLPALRT
jgi:peptide-methionine (R)-S-oxide reductase